MAGVTRLYASTASFDAARRQFSPPAPRRAGEGEGVGRGAGAPAGDEFAADLFAVRLRRALTGAIAADVDPALDSAGARGRALVARDRLAGQTLTIANAVDGSPSLL